MEYGKSLEKTIKLAALAIILIFGDSAGAMTEVNENSRPTIRCKMFYVSVPGNNDSLLDLQVASGDFSQGQLLLKGGNFQFTARLASIKSKKSLSDQELKRTHMLTMHLIHGDSSTLAQTDLEAPNELTLFVKEESAQVQCKTIQHP